MGPILHSPTRLGQANQGQKATPKRGGESPRRPYRPETLDLFKQALWDFVLEHSEIMPNGHLFVKFGVTDRKNLENRIKARWLYEYHREDPKAKEGRRIAQEAAYLAQREEKDAKRNAYKEEQRKRRVRARRREVLFGWMRVFRRDRKGAPKPK